MRLLFGAPRKTGNAYLRCLLAAASGFQAIGLRDAPDGQDTEELTAWLAEIPSRSVAGVSASCSPDLVASAAQHGVTLLGVIRHPFDLFVSNFEVAQQRAMRNKTELEDNPFTRQLSGRTLEDPEILDYAHHGFSDEVDWLVGWQRGAAAIIRYEQLVTDPLGALVTIAPIIGDLEIGAIERAVDMCAAESTIVSRPTKGRRMGPLTPGSWRERLPSQLQDALRERFADEVAQLGYEIT